VVTVPNPSLCNRRERKKQETRAALEAAALRLFAQRGYEQTTVEDIADAADVAVRTFFRYFSSKQHVLFGEVTHNIVERLRACLTARPADEPPPEAVLAAMDGLVPAGSDQYQQVVARMRLLNQLPELMPAFLMIMHELHEAIAEFVAGRTGEPASALYPQVLASAATAAAKASLCSLERGEVTAQELDDLRHRAYRALTAGLDALNAEAQPLTAG
jgi:AcrR family transcriptional regulator